MSDLVERLKKPAPAFGMEYYDPTFDVRQEAAKRIRELEAAWNANGDEIMANRERIAALETNNEQLMRHALAQAKRIAELEAENAALKRDFVKVVERDRAVADAKQAKRITELEAALKADCDAQAQAEAGQRIAELEAALHNLIGACEAGHHVERGAGGMTIDAQINRTVINGVKARAVQDALDVLYPVPDMS